MEIVYTSGILLVFSLKMKKQYPFSNLQITKSSNRFFHFQIFKSSDFQIISSSNCLIFKSGQQFRNQTSEIRNKKVALPGK